MCGAPSRRRAPARRQREQPLADVHLPALLPAVHPRRRGAGLPGGARPLPVVPGPGRAGLGRARDPGRHRVPVPSTRRSTGSSRSTPGRPGRPSRSCRSTPGTGSWRRPRCSRPCARTWRRCWCARSTSRSRPSSCRSTSATSWSGSCGCCGAASTAGRTSRRRLDEFFAQVRTRCRPHGGEVGRDRARLRGGRRCRRSAYAAAPHLIFRLRVTEADGQPSCTRSRCAARCASNRSAGPTTPPSGRGSSTCSARRTGRRHAQAVPVDACDGDGAGLRPASREVDLPVAVHATTSRSVRRSTCTRCATARSRCSLLFSGTVFTRGASRVRRRAAVRGRWRRATGCRSPCGGR